MSRIPGHTGVLGTLTLTQTAVSAVSAGLGELTGTRAGVHGDGLADDEAIADELADGLAGVGVGDLALLVGIEPDLALAAADHGGGEALLGAKVDPVTSEKKDSLRQQDDLPRLPKSSSRTPSHPISSAFGSITTTR